MSTKVSVHPVELRGISKRFGATQAVFQANLTLERGEVHGFAGENGAGKSTLGKILAGVYTQDGGDILVDGELVSRWDTARAQHRGIVLIAQELSLVPDLSIVDNVFLGVEAHHAGVLALNAMRRFRDLEAMCQFGLDPNAKVRSLRLADQQKVEIMRALARDARVIVMDEPTSSLTADEVQKLHQVMRQLRDQGRTIIYVTHFLDAMLEIADRVTVMRDGRVVRTSKALDETEQSLVEAMLGRSLAAAIPRPDWEPLHDLPPRLVVRNMSADNGITDVSLAIRPGEIVGLAGLVGSGRTEIARAIFGADAVTSGDIEVDGIPHGFSTPGSSIREGIVMIPESRRTQGLVMIRSVRENISLPHLRRVSRLGCINRRREAARTTELAEQVAVNPPRLNLPVTDLSGGNQQKVLFAKWLMGSPKLIILDEPTRGVDIGAKMKIYQLIRDLARAGTSVLLISSEHEEVLGLSHRVYLVRNRTIVGELDGTTTSVDDVLFSLFGLGSQKHQEGANGNEH